MLDDIALAILELCDGQTSVAVISQILAEKFGAPAASVEEDVLAFIRELSEKGLVSA